uniref:Uncharacterized protein n=1 Tax=Cannabis sativa TaxID=3483 RepID=A0A803NLC5_CANSA
MVATRSTSVDRQTPATGRTTRGTSVDGVGIGTTFEPQAPKAGLETSSSILPPRPLPTSPKTSTNNQNYFSKRFFEFVRETPHQPTSHVGTSVQGETLNAQNTTATSGNRAGTRKTPGVETSWREGTFDRELERIQARGCQPMGPPPNVERPRNNKRTNKTPPPSSPQRSQETRPRDPVREKRPARKEELNLSNQFNSLHTCDPAEDYFEGSSHYNAPNEHSCSGSSRGDLEFILEASLEFPSRPRGQETTIRFRSTRVQERLERSRDMCDLLNKRRTVDVGTSREDHVQVTKALSGTQITTHGVNQAEFDTLATLVKGIRHLSCPNSSSTENDAHHSLKESKLFPFL